MWLVQDGYQIQVKAIPTLLLILAAHVNMLSYYQSEDPRAHQNKVYVPPIYVDMETRMIIMIWHAILSSFDTHFFYICSWRHIKLYVI